MRQTHAMSEVETGGDVRALTCFVIGPIGNRHAPLGSEERLAYEEALQVYEEVIAAACSPVGLSPVRADGLLRAGEITEQVFRRLRDDDVVIADLTGANPNVMYELGLRHTREKVTLQVGEYGRLPFDVNVIRTVQFSRSPHGLIKARDELTELLQAALAGDADPVTPTRIWNEVADAGRGDSETETTTAAGAVSEEGGDEGGGDDEAPGFLDVMTEGEDAYEDLRAATESIARSIVSMGTVAEQAAEKIQQSDAQGRGMKGRLAITTEFAHRLSAIADELEDSVTNYDGAMNAVSAATLALLEEVERDPEQLEGDEGRRWALTTRGLAKTARESMSSLSEMVASINYNARLARVLREPSRRITEALGTFSRATSAVDEWDRRLQALGAPEPPEDWNADEDEPGA